MLLQVPLPTVADTEYVLCALCHTVLPVPPVDLAFLREHGKPTNRVVSHSSDATVKDSRPRRRIKDDEDETSTVLTTTDPQAEIETRKSLVLAHHNAHDTEHARRLRFPRFKEAWERRMKKQGTLDGTPDPEPEDEEEQVEPEQPPSRAILSPGQIAASPSQLSLSSLSASPSVAVMGLDGEDVYATYGRALKAFEARSAVGITAPPPPPPPPKKRDDDDESIVDWESRLRSSESPPQASFQLPPRAPSSQAHSVSSASTTFSYDSMGRRLDERGFREPGPPPALPGKTTSRFSEPGPPPPLPRAGSRTSSPAPGVVKPRTSSPLPPSAPAAKFSPAAKPMPFNHPPPPRPPSAPIPRRSVSVSSTGQSQPYMPSPSPPPRLAFDTALTSSAPPSTSSVVAPSAPASETSSQPSVQEEEEEEQPPSPPRSPTPEPEPERSRAPSPIGTEVGVPRGVATVLAPQRYTLIPGRSETSSTPATSPPPSVGSHTRSSSSMSMRSSSQMGFTGAGSSFGAAASSQLGFSGSANSQLGFGGATLNFGTGLEKGLVSGLGLETVPSHLASTLGGSISRPAHGRSASASVRSSSAQPSFRTPEPPPELFGLAAGPDDDSPCAAQSSGAVTAGYTPPSLYQSTGPTTRSIRPVVARKSTGEWARLEGKEGEGAGVGAGAGPAAGGWKNRTQTPEVLPEEDSESGSESEGGDKSHSEASQLIREFSGKAPKPAEAPKVVEVPKAVAEAPKPAAPVGNSNGNGNGHARVISRTSTLPSRTTARAISSSPTPMPAPARNPSSSSILGNESIYATTSRRTFGPSGAEPTRAFSPSAAWSSLAPASRVRRAHNLKQGKSPASAKTWSPASAKGKSPGRVQDVKGKGRAVVPSDDEEEGDETQGEESLPPSPVKRRASAPFVGTTTTRRQISLGPRQSLPTSIPAPVSAPAPARAETPPPVTPVRAIPQIGSKSTGPMLSLSLPRRIPYTCSKASTPIDKPSTPVDKPSKFGSTLRLPSHDLPLSHEAQPSERAPPLLSSVKYRIPQTPESPAQSQASASSKPVLKTRRRARPMGSSVAGSVVSGYGRYAGSVVSGYEREGSVISGYDGGSVVSGYDDDRSVVSERVDDRSVVSERMDDKSVVSEREDAESEVGAPHPLVTLPPSLQLRALELMSPSSDAPSSIVTPLSPHMIQVLQSQGINVDEPISEESDRSMEAIAQHIVGMNLHETLGSPEPIGIEIFGRVDSGSELTSPVAPPGAPSDAGSLFSRVASPKPVPAVARLTLAPRLSMIRSETPGSTPSDITPPKNSHIVTPPKGPLFARGLDSTPKSQRSARPESFAAPAHPESPPDDTSRDKPGGPSSIFSRGPESSYSSHEEKPKVEWKLELPQSSDPFTFQSFLGGMESQGHSHFGLDSAAMRVAENPNVEPDSEPPTPTSSAPRVNERPLRGPLPQQQQDANEEEEYDEVDPEEAEGEEDDGVEEDADEDGRLTSSDEGARTETADDDGLDHLTESIGEPFGLQAQADTPPNMEQSFESNRAQNGGMLGSGPLYSSPRVVSPPPLPEGFDTQFIDHRTPEAQAPMTPNEMEVFQTYGGEMAMPEEWYEHISRSAHRRNAAHYAQWKFDHLTARYPDVDSRELWAQATRLDPRGALPTEYAFCEVCQVFLIRGDTDHFDGKKHLKCLKAIALRDADELESVRGSVSEEEDAPPHRPPMLASQRGVDWTQPRARSTVDANRGMWHGMSSGDSESYVASETGRSSAILNTPPQTPHKTRKMVMEVVIPIPKRARERSPSVGEGQATTARRVRACPRGSSPARSDSSVSLGTYWHVTPVQKRPRNPGKPRTKSKREQTKSGKRRIQVRGPRGATIESTLDRPVTATRPRPALSTLPPLPPSAPTEFATADSDSHPESLQHPLSSLDLN
ncbi:hypothetical protein RHS01_09175 [Rhizoctonia solani]|uniref:Uncharacterized protein n=1 Tax=Rhizoctonia solani TaxID=456999 RepID=A0A8H7I4X7_9AGAM|nr:hypothetical protein RHS01_09175 [Rhizoctonia solani]